MSSHERPMCVQGDLGLVLTTNPKARLRWIVELHERFVDAVTQLGGPDKVTPKTIMRAMGVNGLTFYHLKSHLQVGFTATEGRREMASLLGMKNVAVIGRFDRSVEERCREQLEEKRMSRVFNK